MEKPTPEIGYDGCPTWYFHKGNQVDVHLREDRLVFFPGAGCITITKSASIGVWLVEWQLTHAPQMEVHGRFEADEVIVRAIFGAEPARLLSPHRRHEELTNRARADYVIPGYCCRWGDFVTIPSVGTGIALDSNLSIRIKPGVAEAFENFIVRTRDAW